jgi:ribosomal protein S18 acetylase RimI-like enzyme
VPSFAYGQTMAKVRLRPMTDEEYLHWHDEAEADYANSFVRARVLTEDEAIEKARHDFATLLPEGLDTAEHHLWTAVDDATDEAVGMLWLHIAARGTGVHAFVYDVQMHARLRGRGYGRATMLAGEREARRHGARTIGLNVFGFNTTAVRLYDSLGYRVTSQQMEKVLDSGIGPRQTTRD